MPYLKRDHLHHIKKTSERFTVHAVIYFPIDEPSHVCDFTPLRVVLQLETDSCR